MKRFNQLTAVLATAALIAVPAFVFSDDEVTTSDEAVYSFVDEDGDGVCDYYAEGGKGLGSGRGTHGSFVDEDGDGICDYHVEGGEGHGPGKGLRENFIDDDGDGVCDNYVEGARQGRGHGRGGMGYYNSDSSTEGVTGGTNNVKNRGGRRGGRGRR